MKSACTDIFSALVHLPPDLGDAGDAIPGEADRDAFCRQQGYILLGQRGIGFCQDTHEVIDTKRLQLDTDRQAALQLGYQIRWLRQMKGAGSNKQDMVGLDNTELCRDGRTLD